MSFQDQLASLDRKSLKPTKTVVKTMLEVVGDGATRPEPESKNSVLIISKYAYPFEKWLAKSFTKVLLTSSETVAGLPLGARKGFTAVEGFDDFTRNAIVEHRALALHKTHRFTHVVSISEEDLIRAARVRGLLGITAVGQQVDSALRFRDKLLMKDTIVAYVKAQQSATAAAGTDAKSTAAAAASTSAATSAADTKPATTASGESGSGDEKYGRLHAEQLPVADRTQLLSTATASGLRADSVPTYAAVNSVTDVIAFVKLHGYPVVIKPRRAHSSIGLMALRSEHDLVTKFIPSISHAPVDSVLDLEIERFVNGQMYHIDGLVLNDELKVCWPSRYVGTVMEFGANRFIAGVGLDSAEAKLVKRLQSFMRDVLIALRGPANYTFHGEVWVTQPDDRLVLCEVASRTGGGEIRGQILELFGVNLNASSTQAQAGDFITNLKSRESYVTRVPAVTHAVGWVFVYPKSGLLESLPDKSVFDKYPYVIGYTEYLKPGTVYATRDCADACVSFLVKGATHDECVSNIRAIVDIADSLIVWKPATGAPAAVTPAASDSKDSKH